LAAAIESGDPATADANAALIAEHLEAAGDLRDAYSWHMRAATWSTSRDLAAARVSWLRAQEIADRLPADNPDRASMRITPRTLLYGTAWRQGGSADDAAFEELRELTLAAGDRVSLAIAMAVRCSAVVISRPFNTPAALSWRTRTVRTAGKESSYSSGPATLRCGKASCWSKYPPSTLIWPRTRLAAAIWTAPSI